MYSETVSRKYMHRGACCESNALLWLRNIGQRPKGRYNAFFQEQCVGPNFESRNLILLTRDWMPRAISEGKGRRRGRLI